MIGVVVVGQSWAIYLSAPMDPPRECKGEWVPRNRTLQGCKTCEIPVNKFIQFTRTIELHMPQLK